MHLEYFYTIKERIEGDRVNWIEVPRLRRSIESIREKISEPRAIYRYLFDSLPVANDRSSILCHWWAFLQRRCDRVAKPIYEQNRAIIPDYETVFYKLIADPRIAKPIEFFREFDSDRPKAEFFYPTLLNWTDTKLRHILYNSLRKNYRSIGRSNLGLVAISSLSMIREISRGSELDRADSLALVSCFKEVRNAGKLPIDRWKEEHFLAVLTRYREIQNEREITIEELTETLDRIGREIRNYLDPPFRKFEPPLGEDGKKEIWENLPVSGGETARSLEEIREKIQTIIDALPEETRQIVEFYYQRRMAQARIEEKLSIDQSTISHRLDAFRKQVYLTTLAWNEDRDPNTSEKIRLTARQRKDINDYLECYYS
ncbi:hypothetical protein V0288_17530 [Pannus brasiliensis CCIBt3594]|uniref:Sigma-70 family RNA polymerase sigma factor n=1 Tax=Pannus brasiliensis CCIBt3594 TaxID=1427578 RepID=A0AAW9QYL5_9CHRO